MKTLCQNLLVVAILFIIQTQAVFAQDGHYWTQQYGTRSMLLSGSTIGGVSDLGAVYYNPARLSQISPPVFLLSADVYELNSLKIKDAFGENKNATQSEFGGVPSVAAGTFKIPFISKHNFAWSVLVRQNQIINMSHKEEVFDNVIEGSPGKEIFGAEFSMTGKNREEWYGLSWAFPVNEKWSVGASGFFSMVNNRKQSDVNMQSYLDNQQVLLFRSSRYYTINQYKLILKMGISYESEKWLLGMTIQTPSVKLSGEGKYHDEVLFSGLEEIGENEDIYSTSYQDDINSFHLSPISIGFGVTRQLGRNKIHLSSEWFGGIPKYSLLESAEYESQSSGNKQVFNLVDHYKSIINVGLGVEVYLNDKVSFFTSFCTDFSASLADLTNSDEDRIEVYNSMFTSDFYHYGGGFVLLMRKASITLGATYTGALLTIPRPFSFPENVDEEVFTSEEQLEASWNRWRIVFSFSFPFLNIDK